MTTTLPVTADGWDALLSDGSVVRIRPATEADEDRLLALHEAASDRSIYLRYFSLSRRAGDRYVDKVLHGGAEEIVLVAEQHGDRGRDGRLHAAGRTADGEVAMLVADSHQRRGVGTLLLEHLAAVARQAGMRSFVADTLADNGLMQQVFTDAGFRLERHSDLDVTHVRMSLTPTPQAQDAVDLRRAARRRGEPAARAGPGVDRRRRGQRPAGLGRRRRPAEHHRRPLPRNPASGEPAPPLGGTAAGLSVRTVPAGAGRPRDRRGSGTGRGAGDRDCGTRGIPAAVILSPASARPTPPAPTASGSCYAPPAPRASAWSDRTASASPCGPPTRSSTPRSGGLAAAGAVGIASQSGRWASACSPRPRTGTSACPGSSRSATSST
jgi:GNAT superfamily N-acetyltransferase